MKTIRMPVGLSEEEIKVYVSCVNYVAWMIDEKSEGEVTPAELLCEFSSNVAVAAMGNAQGNA